MGSPSTSQGIYVLFIVFLYYNGLQKQVERYLFMSAVEPMGRISISMLLKLSPEQPIQRKTVKCV